MLKKRVRNLFEHKENDEKTDRAQNLSTDFRRENVVFTKAAQNFLRQEKYGKNETIHINSLKNEQFFIPKGQIRAFLRKMHLILYSIWFNM